MPPPVLHLLLHLERWVKATPPLAARLLLSVSGPLPRKTKSSAQGRVSQRYWMLRGRYCGQCGVEEFATQKWQCKVVAS